VVQFWLHILERNIRDLYSLSLGWFRDTRDLGSFQDTQNGSRSGDPEMFCTLWNFRPEVFKPRDKL